MTRVLVPIRILEGESVSFGLMDLLGTMDVTVLGYHVLPEQTPPDQARLQYEDRATEALEDVTQEFRAAGGDADYRLVFTADRAQTIDRVATETGARAYVVTGATGTVDRLLVPLSGDVAVARILSFVAALVGDRDIGVTLFLATGAGEAEAGEGRNVLDEAAATLRDRGLDVRTELVTGVGPFEALIDAVAGHDAVVMGEQAPSLRSMLFGEATDRVAAESVGPVLVVRREEPSEEPT
ncbi:universal stress protein [Salinigranum sp. GCM10025319]|uniref:universal stress protein n=1 Tax=Salinigranum sp. GCM10025319 TaxID=3252687 RepID=UPI003607A898